MPFLFGPEEKYYKSKTHSGLKHDDYRGWARERDARCRRGCEKSLQEVSRARVSQGQGQRALYAKVKASTRVCLSARGHLPMR